MSYNERVTWVYLLVTTLAFLGYLVWLIPHFWQPNIAQIAYVVPLLTAIGVAIVASIVFNIVVGFFGTKRDQRDREIDREGEHHAHFVIDIGAMVATGMALARLEYFWIAHTLYISFVLNAILTTALKIGFYRRGFI